MKHIKTVFLGVLAIILLGLALEGGIHAEGIREWEKEDKAITEMDEFKAEQRTRQRDYYLQKKVRDENRRSKRRRLFLEKQKEVEVLPKQKFIVGRVARLEEKIVRLEERILTLEKLCRTFKFAIDKETG